MAKEMTKKEIEAVRKEIIQTVISRSGVSMKDIYNTAVNNFVAGNLDLLTPSERSKYKAMGFIR